MAFNEEKERESYQTMLFVDNDQQYRIRLPATLAERINKQREQIDKFKTEIGILLSTEQELRERLNKLNTEKNNLASEYEQQIMEWQMKVAMCESENSALNGLNKRIQIETDKKLNQSKKEIDELENNILNLEKEKETLLSQNEKFKNKIARLERENEKLNDESKMRDKSNEEKEAFFSKERDDLKIERQALNENVTQLTIKLTQLTQENKQLKENLSNITESKNKEIDLLNVKLRVIQKECNEKIKEIENKYLIERENERKKMEFEKKEEERLQRLKEEEELKNAELAAIEANNNNDANSDKDENEMITEEYLDIVMNELGFDSKLKDETVDMQKQVLSRVFNTFDILDVRKWRSFDGIMDHCTLSNINETSFKFTGKSRKNLLKRKQLSVATPLSNKGNKYICLKDIGLELLYEMKYLAMYFDKQFSYNDPHSECKIHLTKIDEAIKYQLDRWKEWSYKEVIDFLLSIRNDGQLVCEKYEEKLRDEIETNSPRMNKWFDNEKTPILPLLDSERLTQIGIDDKNDQKIVINAIDKVIHKDEYTGDDRVLFFDNDDTYNPYGESLKQQNEKPNQGQGYGSSGTGISAAALPSHTNNVYLDQAHKFNMKDNMRSDEMVANSYGEGPMGDHADELAEYEKAIGNDPNIKANGNDNDAAAAPAAGTDQMGSIANNGGFVAPAAAGSDDSVAGGVGVGIGGGAHGIAAAYSGPYAMRSNMYQNDRSHNNKDDSVMTRVISPLSKNDNRNAFSSYHDNGRPLSSKQKQIHKPQQQQQQQRQSQHQQHGGAHSVLESEKARKLGFGNDNYRNNVRISHSPKYGNNNNNNNNDNSNNSVAVSSPSSSSGSKYRKTSRVRRKSKEMKFEKSDKEKE